MLLSGALSGGIVVARIAFGCICILFIFTGSQFYVFFTFVLRIPGLGLFILPLGVAGDGVRYLRIRSGFMSGMPLNWSLEMAFRRVAGGKLKKSLMHVLHLLLLVRQCVQRRCRSVPNLVAPHFHI